jgi:hypothetical protein
MLAGRKARKTDDVVMERNAGDPGVKDAGQYRSLIVLPDLDGSRLVEKRLEAEADNFSIRGLYGAATVGQKDREDHLVASSSVADRHRER